MKAVQVVIGILVTWVMVVCAQMATAESLIERTVAIENISKVNVNTAGTMELAIADKESLVVIAPKSVLEAMQIDADGETLRIRDKGRWFWGGGEHIKLRLTLKKLDAMNIASQLNVNVNGDLSGEDFTLRYSGAVNIYMDQLTLSGLFKVHASGAGELKVKQLHAAEVSVHSSGAGKVDFAGIAPKQTVKLTGAAEYWAGHLLSEQVNVNVTGAADAEVWARQTLNISATGASHVRYYGDPEKTVKNTGVSDIHRIGHKPKGIKVPLNLDENQAAAQLQPLHEQPAYVLNM